MHYISSGFLFQKVLAAQDVAGRLRLPDNDAYIWPHLRVKDS